MGVVSNLYAKVVTTTCSERVEKIQNRKVVRKVKTDSSTKLTVRAEEASVFPVF